MVVLLKCGVCLTTVVVDLQMCCVECTASCGEGCSKPLACILQTFLNLKGSQNTTTVSSPKVILLYICLIRLRPTRNQDSYGAHIIAVFFDYFVATPSHLSLHCLPTRRLYNIYN